MVLAVRTSGGKQMAQECCTLSGYFHYSVALVFFLETKSAEAVQTPKLALRNWKAAWAVRLPGCTTRVLLCSEGGRYLWHRPPAAHQPAPRLQHHAWTILVAQVLFRCCCWSIRPGQRAEGRTEAGRSPEGSRWSPPSLWWGARSVGMEGTHTPEMSSLSLGTDLLWPRLQACHRQHFSMGLRRRMESLSSLSAQEWMSSLISNVTFVGH